MLPSTGCEMVDEAKSKRCEKVEVEDGDEAIAQMIPYQADSDSMLG